MLTDFSTKTIQCPYCKSHLPIIGSEAICKNHGDIIIYIECKSKNIGVHLHWHDTCCVIGDNDMSIFTSSGKTIFPLMKDSLPENIKDRVLKLMVLM
jgi:hypothetical protein